MHSYAFKVEVVATRALLGMSMAAVAMAHGMNANLLRRCVHEAEMKPRGVVVREGVLVGAAARDPKTVFVSVSLPPSDPPAPVPDIRIELRPGPTTVTVIWPAGAASDCAVWMR